MMIWEVGIPGKAGVSSGSLAPARVLSLTVTDWSRRTGREASML